MGACVVDCPCCLSILEDDGTCENCLEAACTLVHEGCGGIVGDEGWCLKCGDDVDV